MLLILVEVSVKVACRSEPDVTLVTLGGCVTENKLSDQDALGQLMGGGGGGGGGISKCKFTFIEVLGMLVS